MKTKHLLKQIILPILFLAVSFNLQAATGTLDIGGTTGNDLTQNTSGTGWTWKADSETLSLTSAYTGGSITINSQPKDHIKLVYTGNVTVASTLTDAIFCNGNLTVNGSGGALTTSYTGNDFYGGLTAYGNLTISSGIVSATRSGEYTGTTVCTAIYSYYNTIDGSATVTGTATGGTAIGIFGNTVTINTTGTVTASGTGKEYAMAFNLKLNGGTVNLNHSGGLFVERTLTRTGGILKCNGIMVTNGQGTEFVDASDLKFQVRTESSTTGTAAVISNQYDGASYTIPASFAYNGISYDITEIAGFAFQNCFNLTGLTFLGNAPTFDDDVFWNITNALTITVPVGQKAAYKTALEGVLPNGSTISETGSAGIEDINAGNIRTYQSGGVLHIESPEYIREIRLHDISGSLVFKQENAGNSFNVSALPNGVYILTLVSARGEMVGKIVKE